MIKKIFSGIAIVLSLSACSVHFDNPAVKSSDDQSAKSGEAVEDGLTVSEKETSNADELGLRSTIINETFYAVAFQESVRKEYKKILNKIEPLSDTMDEIFNFEQLMYQGKMLPPVIQESNDYYGKLSDKSLVQTAKRWLILKDASVSIMPPKWQSYLFQGIDGQDNLVKSGLELRNDEEKELAIKAKNRAAKEAQDYIVQLLKLNLARLKRDYIGMLTYKQLEMQGIVSAPVLAVSDEPYVITQGNREALVGAKRYLITYDSQFNKHKDWKPIVSNKAIDTPIDRLFTPPRYEAYR